VFHRRTIFFILLDYPPVNPMIAKASLLHGINRHYSQYYKCGILQSTSKHSVTIFIVRHTYLIICHKEMHFLVLAFIFPHHVKPGDKVRSFVDFMLGIHYSSFERTSESRCLNVRVRSSIHARYWHGTPVM